MFVDTGKKQKDAAEAIGVSESNFSKYLSGKVRFPEHRLFKLAEFFGVHSSVLVNVPAPVIHTSPTRNSNPQTLNQYYYGKEKSS
jgi:transcriptional regulator with XRE-family HTH domain